MILKDRIEKPLADLAADFENIFGHVFSEGTTVDSQWAPRTNILETDSGYSVEMELPGLDSENISVELTDGVLEVSGKKEIETEVAGARLLKSERRDGSFRRNFKFETLLEADRISAQLRNGVLTISLPKSETVLPRKIKVKIAD